MIEQNEPAPPAWTPDQFLGADATDEHIEERFRFIVTDLGNGRGPFGWHTASFYEVGRFVAREFAAACVAAVTAGGAAPSREELVRTIIGALQPDDAFTALEIADAILAKWPGAGLPSEDTARLDWTVTLELLDLICRDVDSWLSLTPQVKRFFPLTRERLVELRARLLLIRYDVRAWIAAHGGSEKLEAGSIPADDDPHHESASPSAAEGKE